MDYLPLLWGSIWLPENYLYGFIISLFAAVVNYFAKIKRFYFVRLLPHNEKSYGILNIRKIFILAATAKCAKNVRQKFCVLRRRTQPCCRKARTTTKTHEIYADRICAFCCSGEYTFCKKQVYYRQHRTEIVVRLRRLIFRQIAQNRRIRLAPMRRFWAKMTENLQASGRQSP